MSALSVPIDTQLEPIAAKQSAIVSTANTALWLAGSQVLTIALLGGAMAINDGRLHWQALQWLAFALLALAGGVILCRGGIAKLVSRRAVHVALALVIAAQFVHLALIGTSTVGEQNLPRAALLSCLLLIDIGLIVALATRFRVLGGGLMVGAFAVAGWAAVYSTPHVLIDVIVFQQESAQAILNGENPYGARYRNIYHPNTEFYGPGSTTADGWLTYSFPYPPLSALMSVPGHLGGDVRFAQVGALAIAATILMLAGRNATSFLAAAALLTTPRALHVVVMGWTEPFLILAASWLLFAAIRARWMLWLGIGVLMALKQYLIVIAPLLFLLRMNGETMSRLIGRLLQAGLFAATVTLPFALVDLNAFVRSTIEWQLVQPFRYDALSFPAMAGQLGQSPASGMLGFAAAGAASLIALWKSPRTAGGFFAAAALVLCFFFACNKQAFCNYYLLVIGLCCCAIVGLSSSREVGRVTFRSNPAK
jgi:hypothetical protein